MAIVHQIVTLNSSTATLVSIPLSAEAPYETKVSLSIQNVDTSAIAYIGNQDVTSSSYGYALTAGSAVSFDLLPGDTLYAISDSGTPTVAVIAAEA